MKENIKIGLMALIAVTLIINTFSKGGGSETSADPASSSVANTVTPANPTLTNVSDIQANDPVVDARPKTKIAFKEIIYDFGDVEQDTENKHVFSFTNSGDEPLVISNAKGSCGCTVPNYPREPIAPGESGEIEVVYSPGKQQNQQSKTVTITANTNPETSVLQIKANVLPAAGDSEG